MRERTEATPASVVSLLLAFYREPALRRPAVLHDADGIAGGAHIFRFAVGKFPPALLRTLGAEERSNVRQAACAFIRQVCFWEAANHYQVLALRRDCSIDDVKEHYRLLMALVHPDRHEPDLETEQAWPTGCVQRANAAYAVLGDAGRRAAYDAETRKPAAGSAASAGSRPALPHHRVPIRRKAITAAIVVAAVLALGAVQLTWMQGRDAPDWLPHAMPRASGDAAHEPRFLSFARASALLTELIQAPALPSLPAPVAIDPAVSPPPLAPRAAATPPANPVTRAGSMPEAAPMPAIAYSTPRNEAARATPPIVMAQATSTSVRSDATSRKDKDVSNKDVELLLAKLVGYYEAGDIDRFMTLFDQPGFWNAMQTRDAYETFFRSTKERRLRIDSLSWNVADGKAFARGKAEVVAGFHDGSARLDRTVDVEIDIALYQNGARISRLSLFPNGP